MLEKKTQIIIIGILFGSFIFLPSLNGGFYAVNDQFLVYTRW